MSWIYLLYETKEKARFTIFNEDGVRVFARADVCVCARLPVCQHMLEIRLLTSE